MFYVNGKKGIRRYSASSTEPEAVLLYYEDAVEKRFEVISIMNKAGQTFTETDLRQMINRRPR